MGYIYISTTDNNYQFVPFGSSENVRSRDALKSKILTKMKQKEECKLFSSCCRLFEGKDGCPK
jgi:hypothetical protein